MNRLHYFPTEEEAIAFCSATKVLHPQWQVYCEPHSSAPGYWVKPYWLVYHFTDRQCFL